MAGRSYLVGERGPETFVPWQSGSIVAAGGGAQTFNISIQTQSIRDLDNDSAIQSIFRRMGRISKRQSGR